MAYACRFCIALRGLKPEEIGRQPQTWLAAAEHVEREHRYTVRRADETQEQAEYRVYQRHRKRPAVAAQIVGHLQGAAQLIEIIERMGPIIQVHAVPHAEDALELIRNLPSSGGTCE